MEKKDEDELFSLLKTYSFIENNIVVKQIINTFGKNDINKRLLTEFYIKVPTNIYIRYHPILKENLNLNNTMPFYDIKSFIVVLSLNDNSLLENKNDFIKLNEKLLENLRKENQGNQGEIKGGGIKKNKYIVINDGGNKRYVLFKNNKYQILNENDNEYLLSTKNRGIIRMKK